MFEKFTDTELHKMELRCLDLLMDQNDLERANAQMMMSYVRLEIDHRALSAKNSGLRHQGIHLATRARI